MTRWGRGNPTIHMHNKVDMSGDSRKVELISRFILHCRNVFMLEKVRVGDSEQCKLKQIGVGDSEQCKLEQVRVGDSEQCKLEQIRVGDREQCKLE